MANLFARKPLDRLMKEADEVGEHSLKRSLGWVNLVALGIGGIIGAGLFIRTAAAIADRAGPSVVLSFIVAGIGCTFAGLCYAEFASMIPVAGSAYTYSYATMGEFVAWIIGWDLILEYAVAAATVSTAWSEYANRVLSWFNMRIPYQWSHSPFEHDPGGVYGMMNVPAVFILLRPTLLLIRGTKESAFANGLIVILKVKRFAAFMDRLAIHQSGEPHADDSSSDELQRRRRASRTTTAAFSEFWAPRASFSSPTSGSMPFRPPRRKRETPSATCQLGFSARSFSARFSTSCSLTC
jgi:hypothetical protein